MATADSAGVPPGAPRRAEVSYVPGGLTAVTGDQWLALIDAAPGSPAISRIWQHFGTGAAADALLAGLIADGIDRVPGFALLLAEADGRHRLFCRGEVGATIVNGGGVKDVPERVDGAGLLTWREQLIVDAERIFLGALPSDAALWLPAATGVVLAGCVIADFAGSARDTAPDVPVQPRKTIVVYPDTITVTGPGAIHGQAAGAPAAGAQRRLPDGPDDGDWSGHASGAGSADGADGDYDYLWGATMARSVADAAIGPPADDGPFSPGPPLPGGIASPVPPPGAGTRVSPRYPGPPALDPWQAPGPAPVLGARPPAPPGGLIDVPPWLSGPGGTAPVQAGAWAEKSLFEPPSPSGDGDSASTVKRGDPSALAAAAAGPDRIGPTVPALICPAGHLNPPSEAACRRCGGALPLDPVPVPRPVLGVLRLSLGDVIALDRDVIMGRSPRTDFGGADGEERPHVVRLPSAEGDISRNHLRVTLDGWHVLVTDLNSTNGTLVTLPGRDPEQLRPGEPLLLRPGTVVTLAEGIDFRYEVAG